MLFWIWSNYRKNCSNCTVIRPKQQWLFRDHIWHEYPKQNVVLSHSQSIPDDFIFSASGYFWFSVYWVYSQYIRQSVMSNKKNVQAKWNLKKVFQKQAESSICCWLQHHDVLCGTPLLDGSHCLTENVFWFLNWHPESIFSICIIFLHIQMHICTRKDFLLHPVT